MYCYANKTETYFGRIEIRYQPSLHAKQERVQSTLSIVIYDEENDEV